MDLRTDSDRAAAPMGGSPREPMGAYPDYGRWLASERFTGELIETRSIGFGAKPRAAPLRLYRTRQKAAVNDPAVPELTIQLLTGGEFSYAADFGFGRFSGVKRRGQFDVTVPGMECRIATVEPARSPQELLILAIPIQAVKDQWSTTGRTFKDFSCLHAQMTTCPTTAGLMQLLWSEAVAPHGCSGLFADGAITAISAKLDRLARSAPLTNTTGGLAPWQVRRVTEYLHAHLAENVSLTDLASVAGLSPYHFARAFKQSTGVPPHAFHGRLRVERARSLLEHSNLPITEIAVAVGYESPQTLARVFKRDLGVTPSAYRRDRQR